MEPAKASPQSGDPPADVRRYALSATRQHLGAHKPEAELWVDGRTKPVRTSFGSQPLDASLTARLSGDTLHKLLLGTLPLGRALLFRKLKVEGSRTAAMKLESLLHACQAVYPGLADEMLGHPGS